MIKALGIILLLTGVVGLILGVFGIFGTPLVVLNSWALAILGLIFFSSGIGLLKRTGDTNR
ncbi:hypothetical protein C900_03195 [Fulvivirga imtechensis AK7]|uniref:Uncharacterized protein n=1 Tax=Fulvivirga imtechensis AK7 TaxID=1237149 RepID=L8JQD2_9BACT|nr:hypothetical protein [Fulvivirga imtechensis]ELR71065.1 hypothetical protein C900_03195 [Fulvivirga imtechensis AK7]